MPPWQGALTFEVTPLDATLVGDFSTTHPGQLPRTTVPLVARLWDGTRCDCLGTAYAALLRNGVAVLESPDAMFRMDAAPANRWARSTTPTAKHNHASRELWGSYAVL